MYTPLIVLTVIFQGKMLSDLIEGKYCIYTKKQGERVYIAYIQSLYCIYTKKQGFSWDPGLT